MVKQVNFSVLISCKVLSSSTFFFHPAAYRLHCLTKDSHGHKQQNADRKRNSKHSNLHVLNHKRNCVNLHVNGTATQKTRASEQDPLKPIQTIFPGSPFTYGHHWYVVVMTSTRQILIQSASLLNVRSAFFFGFKHCLPVELKCMQVTWTIIAWSLKDCRR